MRKKGKVMLEFKHTIEEKAYNDMRELVGWRRLDPQQAQTGLDNSVFTTVAYDAKQLRWAWRASSATGGYMYLIVDVMVHPDYQKQGLGLGTAGTDQRLSGRSGFRRTCHHGQSYGDYRQRRIL